MKPARAAGYFIDLEKFSKEKRRSCLSNTTFQSGAGDAIGHVAPAGANAEFDALLSGRTIQSLPRSVIVELASIDGAVVVDSKGTLLAFGAVLQPKKRGNLRTTEGSRTKAAVGASNYGLAVKVSADGAITVYRGGNEFFEV
jgi:hypothetical protein